MSHARPEPELLLRHAAHVRELARRLVFDADLARDVEQETWLAALEHSPRDLRDPRAWLARVVRNVARRKGSRRTRRRDVEAGAVRERLTHGDTQGEPSELYEREQAIRRLLAAVRRLPEPVRAAIVLHSLDGLTLGEVARRTGAPLETVRSRVKRGMALLREDLSREQRGEANWCLALTQAWRLAPPSSTRALLVGARELLLPLTIMSSTFKIATATSSLALALLAGWLWIDRPVPEAPGESNAIEAAAPVPEIVALSGVEAPRESAEVIDAQIRTAAVAAPESLPATTGSLELTLVWSGDRKPAANVSVSALPQAAGRASDRTWHESSEAGRVAFADLAPGRYWVHAVVGGATLVDVPAGETITAVIEIPQGIEVSGRVRDADGSPVAGAAIFLSPGGLTPPYEGAVVAHSDALGRFALRSTPARSGACLSARAAGRTPTDQVVLTGAPASTAELELVFEADGRTFSGRVVSPSGEPVVDAAILVGSEREYVHKKRADGTAAYPPVGELIRSGPDGSFELRGAPLESMSVQVRAPGYPVWRGTWEANGPDWLEVRLEAGASVSGIVRGSDGSPVVGAQIHAGAPRGFAAAVATSDADGAYTLGPLSGSDSVDLVAQNASGGRTTTTLPIAAGQLQRWDPVLDAGLEVHGRVDASGPLDGWRVHGVRQATGGEGLYIEFATTDAQGKFVLRRAPEGEITVVLYGRGGTPFRVAQPTSAVSGGPEVVLRPDPELLPSARIVGRLVDESGEPVRNGDIRAMHQTLGSTLVHPDPNDGTFALGPMPAGRWTLTVDAHVAGWGVARQTRALGDGETWDLGALALGGGGTVEVTIAAELVSSSAPITARVFDARDRVVEWLRFEAATVRSRPLVPGEYSVVFPEPGSVEPLRRTFVIAAGQETRVDLQSR